LLPHEAFAALPNTQNGTATVLLPALGIGTCWLTPEQTYDAVTKNACQKKTKSDN
jgi:hypothetical protein